MKPASRAGLGLAASLVAAYALLLRPLPLAWPQLVVGFSGPDPAAWLRRALAWQLAAAVVAIMAAAVLCIAAWRMRRQPWRARARWHASAAVLHVLAHASASLWLGNALRQMAPWGSSRDASQSVPWDWLVEPSHLPWLVALLVVDALAWVVTLVLGIIAWWRLPARWRRSLGWGFDFALVAVATGLAFKVPMTPASQRPEDIAASTLRLLLTCFALVRWLWRMAPWLLRRIERLGFAPLVAARHMQARKSRFLAAIALLSVLAVGFSSCALATTLSVMGGFRDDLQSKILGSHAHLVIDDTSGSLQAWQPWLQRLRNTPGVAAATPYVSGEVMITSSANLSGAVLRGIDPDSVAQVTDLSRNLRRGSLATLRRVGADGLPSLLLGQELARSLRVDVGDELNVVSPFGGELGPSGPLPKLRAMRVAGIFYSGMYEYDMKYAYAQLQETQRFFAKDGAVSGLEAKMADANQAPAVAAALRRLPLAAGVRIRDWQELNQSLFGALALEKLAMFVTLGIAVLVAGFCVFGTLTLLVQEKMREVAILAAMGSAPGRIMRIFVIEGLMIGGLGAGLGLGMGFVVCFAARHFGIRMNPEVYYIDRLPVHIDAGEFMSVAVAAVAVCLLATLFPAYLAGRTLPSEALRYE